MEAIRSGAANGARTVHNCVSASQQMSQAVQIFEVTLYPPSGEFGGAGTEG
jgi:hypothetical protein